MNTAIEERTNNKIKENQSLGQHTWQFSVNGIRRTYLVFPHVFSPAIFLGTQWLTHQVLKHTQKLCSFLQIGCGVGVTSIQVYLRDKSADVTCCDVNQHAVENARANASALDAQVKVIRSDIFECVPPRKFEAIYWNLPFHPSAKKYQQLTLLEKAVRDPGYQVLARFLSQAEDYLSGQGTVLLGFSLTMGDLEQLLRIAQKYGYTIDIIQRMDQSKGTICLIALRSAHGHK